MEWSAALAQRGGGEIARGEGKAVVGDQGLEISSDRLAISDQPVEGSAVVTVGRDRGIRADINLPRLTARKAENLSGVALGVSGGSPEVRIGSVDELLWPGLGPWRLDATLDCAAFGWRGAGNRDLRMRLLAQGGELDLRLMSDDLDHGKFRARYVQDALEEKHQLSLSLVGAELRLLLREFMEIAGVEGAASFRADVQASGRVVADILRSSEGNAGFGVERARVEIGRVASSGLDLLDVALRASPALEIDRATGSFVIEGGRAHSDDLAFSGPLVGASGFGTIDVNERTLDFRIKPALKMGARRLAAPVSVTGPWSSLQISADANALMEADLIENILGGLLGDRDDEASGGQKSEKRGGR